MTAIVTNRYRHSQLDAAKRRLDDSLDAYYLGIGRSQEWSNEASPPTPTITAKDERDARLSLQSVKKITDYIECVPRYNWTSGSTYVAWDDNDSALYTKQFYVLNTNSFNVYICLKAGSSTSTVEPTGTSTSVPTAGGDGYIWKYLYTIDASSVTKYLTTNYMPVLRNASVAAAAVQGAIHNIVIDTAGVGYGSAPTITIDGDGSSAAATCTVSGGAIDSVTITNVGSGYTYAKITLSGGSPSSAATLRPVIAPSAIGREIDSIDIDTAGSSYTNGTVALTIDGDGSGATATVTVTGGAAASTSVTGAGYRYTQAAVTLNDTSGSGAVFTTNFSGLKGGFGYDPTIDLGATYLMFNITLDGAEGSGDFIINNDYRQLMIIKNPLNLDSDPEVFTDTTGIALKYLDVDAGGTWVVDDIIEGASSSTQAYVAYYDSANEYLYYFQTDDTGYGDFTDGESLAAIGSGTSTGAVATSGASNAAEVNRFSGELMYLENRVAVSRSSSQTEDIKLVVRY